MLAAAAVAAPESLGLKVVDGRTAHLYKPHVPVPPTILMRT